MENKQDIKDLIQKFYPYAKDKLGFEHPVRVVMRQDAENAKDSLGKTAYYDPAEKLIVLYVTNRHPKDVLRSFSHELVHHAQNCRGDLDDLSTDGRYAEDGKGREIEAEAYLLGNGFLVRDWEDGKKQNEGVNKMKVSKSELKKIIQEELEKARKEKVDEQAPGLALTKGPRQGPDKEPSLGIKSGDETDRSDDNRFLDDKELRAIAQAVDDLGNLDTRIIQPAMEATKDPKMKKALANIQSVVGKVENDIYYLFGPDTLREAKRKK